MNSLIPTHSISASQCIFCYLCSTQEPRNQYYK